MQFERWHTLLKIGNQESGFICQIDKHIGGEFHDGSVLPRLGRHSAPAASAVSPDLIDWLLFGECIALESADFSPFYRVPHPPAADATKRPMRRDGADCSEMRGAGGASASSHFLPGCRARLGLELQAGTVERKRRVVTTRLALKRVAFLQAKHAAWRFAPVPKP